MQYTSVYDSPMGEILIACEGEAISGLWFFGSKYFADGLSFESEPKLTPVIREARRWLDVYFSGRDPGAPPPVYMSGTEFQMDIWNELCQIPYGQTVTYGCLAAKAARRRGMAKMSAQAVGSAVGRNRITLMVPCHRVVGAGGALCGYAAGLDRKAALLSLENIIV